MPATVTAQGITIQTAAEIAIENANKIRALTGNASLPFTADTFLGQLNEAFSDREASLQELLQGLTTIWRLWKAQGAFLSDLVPIGGEYRKPATHSEILGVQLYGTAGTSVPVGVLLGMPNLAPRFATDSTVTIAAATAWAQSTAYTVGDIVTANSQVWLCSTAGTSASSGTGPTGTSPIYDGSVRWLWQAGGDGIVTVDCHAVDTGPIACAAASLTQIVTPFAGLTGCYNPDAATPGVNAETDQALRLRYSRSFSLPGSATHDAIIADLLALDGVQQIAVYGNRTSFYGGNGIPGQPPHSVWAIVLGTATPQIVGNLLFATVADGIQIGWAAAPNAQAVTVTDSQQVSQVVYYSTPDDVPVDVDVSIVYGSVTGPDSVAAAVTAVLADSTIGGDVRLWRMQTACGDAMTAAGIDPESVSAIIVTMRRGSDPFTAANIPIDYFEIATVGAVSVAFS